MTNTDEEKRGKMLVLAAFIALAIFVSKITQADSQIVVWRIYLNSSLYFIITFIGLLWAFRFQVKKRGILFLLHSALYVFSQSLFIEFFFFQKFNRIYEAFILLFLMFLVFLGNYVSFLMANVLNVDLFKKIPLAQVARTSSYLISLLMMYFFTFSFLVSGLEVYVILPLIFLSYFLIIFIHYINIGMEKGELFRKVCITLVICFNLFLGMFLTGDSHEIVSAIPVLGYYLAVGGVTQEGLSYKDNKGFWIYMVMLLTGFILAVFLNI